MNATLVGVALISIAVAVAMTVIVLRMVWQERQRSAARVAALAAEIHSGGRDLPLQDEAPSVAAGEMFAATQPPSPRGVLGAGVLAFGIAAAIVLAVGATRYWTRPDGQSSQPARITAPQATTETLELLALDHERADDHLTVRGIVRNPARGSEVDHLTAVVLLFNQQGGFLTSGRGAVETAALQPGAEAAFEITVPGAADVGRYRVSFRTDDHVVPHVDRRHGQG
jgi:hypothetical protein